MACEARKGLRRQALGCAVAWAGLMAAPAAPAAVYQVVQSGPDEITVVDPGAIEAIPGAADQRRAWSVSVKRVLVSGGPQQPGYVRTLSDYDCAGRKVRWKSFYVYSRFGDLVMRQDNPAPAWQGSDADPGLRTVCGDIRGGSAVSASSIGQLVLSLMQAWDEAAPLPPLQPVTPPAPARRSRAKRRS